MRDSQAAASSDSKTNGPLGFQSDDLAEEKKASSACEPLVKLHIRDR